MVLHNPNNWHWVSKNAGDWAQAWLVENLTKISAEDGGVNAKITKVVSMDGDVDVSQRKGKVITIFDVKLVLEYSGMSLSQFPNYLPFTYKSIRHCPRCRGCLWYHHRSGGRSRHGRGRICL